VGSDVAPGARVLSRLFPTQAARKPRLHDRVLVDQFDDGQGGLLEVAVAGVGVAVGEKLLGVFAMEAGDVVVEILESLPQAEALVVGHSVPGPIDPADVEVEVAVDAALLEFGHEEVEAVELRGVEAAGGLAIGREEARPFAPVGVEEVEADAIDAESGDLFGHSGRVGFFREAGSAGEVHPPQPQPSSPPIYQVPALDADVAVFARRALEQPGQVEECPCVRSPRDLERFHCDFLL